MRRHLLALICLSAAVGALAASSSSSSSLAWRSFKSEHAKVYEPEEDAMRFANFLATKQLVERHNANPNATFKMSLNHMADWTREEWEQLISIKVNETQRKEREVSLSPKLAKLLDGPVPKEVDWRKVANRVTDVKEQRMCMSSWAFATTGLLEGQQAPLGMKELIPLSEQMIVDCSPSNKKCSGGFVQLALDDITFMHVGSEAEYPYEGKVGICRRREVTNVMTDAGGYNLNYGDEKALMKAVANYGPVAVSVYVSHNFGYYKSGVLDDPQCTPGSPAVNHDVLIVGYGTDPKGGDYWLIKNSWTTKWGEEGYIRLKRGVNMCAIADYATVAYF